MKSESVLVVNYHFMTILSEELAGLLSLLAQCSCEQHDLLFFWCLTEDFLCILSHIELVQNFITFINYEELHIIEGQLAITTKPIESAGSSHDDCRNFFGELNAMFLVGSTTIYYINWIFAFVHKFCEAFKLTFDLISKLPCMAKYKNRTWVWIRSKLVQSRKNKYRSLTHSRLGLADEVNAKYSLRYAFLLNFRRVFKATAADCLHQFRFQQKVLKWSWMYSSECQFAVHTLVKMKLFTYFYSGLKLSSTPSASSSKSS